jgi:hypothetical protein
LRQDRLRAQVNKIGAWTATPDEARTEADVVARNVLVFIRNSSELPVTVHRVEVSVQDWKFELGPADQSGERQPIKRFGDSKEFPRLPGTIAPSDLRQVDLHREPRGEIVTAAGSGDGASRAAPRASWAQLKREAGLGSRIPIARSSPGRAGVNRKQATGR